MPAIGVEPITVALRVRCSAIELRGLDRWRQYSIDRAGVQPLYHMSWTLVFGITLMLIYKQRFDKYFFM